MPRFDLVVFDLAGTTVYDGDSVGGAMQRALAEMTCLELPMPVVNSVMGLATKPIAIAKLLRDAGREVIPSTVESVNSRFVQLMLEHYRQGKDVREIDGASSLFQDLRAADMKVGLNTAFSREIADLIFERLGWRRGSHYDASMSAEEVSRGRPAPYMIFRLMEITGVTDVGRVAKVGDTPTDIREGHSAGCGLVVAVTYGTHSRARLESETHAAPFELADSIEGVRDLLCERE